MSNKRRQKFENVPDVVRARMRCIRKTDTRPELAVRRTVHNLGYRYRLHRKDLPGTPNLVFPSLRKVILVHGCFWHQHRGCQSATIPRVRQAYWLQTLARNQARDYNTINSLTNKGGNTLVVWECSLALRLGRTQPLSSAIRITRNVVQKFAPVFVTNSLSSREDTWNSHRLVPIDGSSLPEYPALTPRKITAWPKSFARAEF